MTPHPVTTESSMLIPGLGRVWQVVLQAGFSLLCLRFLLAATRETYPDVWPVLVLGVGCWVLGCWLPRSALFAFAVSVPLLNGLGSVGLAGLPAPVSLVFSGVFVGGIMRQIASRFVGHRSPVTGLKGGLEPLTHDPRPSKAMLAADVLITAVLASLVAQIWRHHDIAGFWTTFWGRPVFGYEDPLYFITAAFLWLQGLFFFRLLSAQGRDVVVWAKPLFVVYGGTLAAFYLFQLCFRIPEPYHTISYCLPFEDIHSFGSIAVAVFAFAAVSWQKRPWIRTALHGIGVIGLLALVVASWSRATWLAGAVIFLLVAWIRLPRRWSMAVLALGIMAIAIINLNANRESWQHNGYLVRLVSLARVENLTNKSPDRLNLYHKVIGMIREHPLVGHGIGSTYLTSVRFARPGDPYADVPNFAHNFLLQMAAELGVPAAGLFAALIVFALHRGYRAARSCRVERRGKREEERSESGAEDIRTPDSCLLSPQHAMLAVTIALVAYLITQMTANALNIYVSNQFFFWFLMAALLSFDTETAESAGAYPSASISVD